MKTATKDDFKAGNTLYNEYGGWRILRKYDDGIWEARGEAGEKCVFEGEAKFYQVEEQ